MAVVKFAGFQTCERQEFAWISQSDSQKPASQAGSPSLWGQKKKNKKQKRKKRIRLCCQSNTQNVQIGNHVKFSKVA